VETTKQNKGTRRKKPHRPDPEEYEGMRQHQHCPPVKHRGDENPKYHEGQHNDVASTLAAHPPKTVEKKWMNMSITTIDMLHADITA
jgi:hypothetical protein